jgi:hypothetical protein
MRYPSDAYGRGFANLKNDAYENRETTRWFSKLFYGNKREARA